MTIHTPPKPIIEWEPIPEGITLHIEVPDEGQFSFKMPQFSANELWRDMEESYMLSRGKQRIVCEMRDVEPGDVLFAAGREVIVASTYLDGREHHTLQSREGAEIRHYSDDTVTVYRSME